MKKIIIVLITLASLQITAQNSFYKGALVTDLTTGIDVYRVHYHTTNKQTGGTLSDTTDGAGAKSYSLGVEYGVLDWLGLGLRGRADNYITSKDKNTGYTATATGGEMGLIVNFHVLRKKHFNLILGMDLGYSHLTDRANDPTNLILYGNGSWANFHITPRYYFGRFGLCMSLNFPTINYPNLTTNNSTINNEITSTWKAHGFGVNFGIQYRFLNSR